MMGYSYQVERPGVFLAENQASFLKARDKAKELIELAGAASSEQIISGCGAGDDWLALAFVDRLVELGEIIEISNTVSRAGQHRLFIRPYKG